jgi:hypothetical protein
MQVLHMDPSPVRFEWANKIFENRSRCYRRRRLLLEAINADLFYSRREWDELPASVRCRLSAPLAIADSFK